jgi:hypothetical protein
MLVYIAMPLAWGVLSGFRLRRSTWEIRFRKIAFALAASLALIFIMTWMAHGYQADVGR